MRVDFEILLASDNDTISEQIIQQLPSDVNVRQLKLSELKPTLAGTTPEVILLVQPEDGSGIEWIDTIHREHPTAIIVFVAEQQDFMLLRDATRAGAADFFAIPEELAQFADRMTTIVQVTKQQRTARNQAAVSGQSMKRGAGKVYAFYSGKGGSGRTLLATTYAQTLKLESTAQVLLIDLNLQYGGVETFLGIESTRSLADLKPVIDELNENHIRNVTETESHSKLELLLSPRDAEVAETVSDDDITKLIRACRRSYDFVIIDLPAQMDAITYAALEESEHIYYIINPDTPSVRVYKHVEELFKRLGMDTEGRLQLVVNKKGRENELNASDLKQFIDVSVEAEIRRDIKGVQSLVNRGQPLRHEPRQKKMIPAAKDIHKWVTANLK